MRLGLLALSLSCLVACVAPPPRHTATRHLRRPEWSCQLREAEVYCEASGAHQELDVPFTPRAVAARPRGGAYVLGEAGLLARFSLHGALSGLTDTPLRSLVVSHDFVCGLDDGGVVWCARDTSRDRVCAESDMAPFAVASEAPASALFADVERDTLCLLDHAGQRRCVPARASCGRSCLAFPACATPRCIDPCPAESEQPSAIFFSASSSRAATLQE